MTPDPITAALDHLSQLDAREAGHFTAISGRLTELTDLVTAIGRTLQDDTAALAKLEALDLQVADLAAQLPQAPGDADRHQPDPAPTWWRLHPADRQEPITHLRA
jgi:hypothetical protein